MNHKFLSCTLTLLTIILSSCNNRNGETEEPHTIYYKIYVENGKCLFLADIFMTPDRTVHPFVQDFEDNYGIYNKPINP